MDAYSVAQDEPDQTKLRHGRSRDAGGTVISEYYQSCPFFFSRESATLNLIGMYRGACAFLIAGGPSFAKLDKQKLDAVWTMTLNNACVSYRGNASCIVDDPSRFSYSMWLDPRILKFAPLSAFEKPLWDNRLLCPEGKWIQQWEPAGLNVGDCPNVVGYRRNERFQASQFLYEDTINWGCHKQFGGGRSVMLPALRILFLLGFRRVYLLGVDFEMTPFNKYHFNEERKPGAIHGNTRTYLKLQKWFEELQPYFIREQFIVKNCNPESKLTAFPFISFEDAILEATAPMGAYTNEKTNGMYQPFAEKSRKRTKPPRPCCWGSVPVTDQESS